MNNFHRILSMLVLTGLLITCSGREDDSIQKVSADSALTTQPTEYSRTVPSNPEEIVNTDGLIETHAISLRSEPKYPPGFSHFDYVNPDAPKEGTVILAATGSFDNFNWYASRGVSAPGSNGIYDSLAQSSEDEIEVNYGLIADKMIYPPDYTWIIFHIDSRATFQDGLPITAHDVKFSFEKFMTEGVSQFREYFNLVNSVEVLDDYRVKFELKESNKELLVNLSELKILPTHFWKDRDFSEPLLEPPVGSGSYFISDYKMGDYVVYKRLDTYWAKDHPVNKGIKNFEYYRFVMYRDSTVQLEALKSGNIDIKIENDSKQWVTQYIGPNFDSGLIKKQDIPNESPPSSKMLFFNTERKKLADRRVRQALTIMLDFEWMNTKLFYNQYKRTRSYFQNTPFEAMGLPSDEELTILEPILDQIPPEVFSEEYQPNRTDGSGNIRREMEAAVNLFAEAGWELRDKTMVNTQTGNPFTFEILIYNPNDERIAIPYQENLKKIGIDMEIHMVDSTLFISRLRSRDFDMIPKSISVSYYPSSILKVHWHSDYLDSSYNSAGVQEPAIDYLLEGISDHQDNNAELLFWGRALDRVLQWQNYSLPGWHTSYYRVAWWDKFSRPEIKPKYSLGLNTWWYDEKKAARLEDG